MTRQRLLDGARIVVGLLVLVAIFAALQGNWDKVAPELARLSWVSLGGAFLLALVAPWLTLVGWRVLLADLGTPLPLPSSASVFFVGQLGKYLPGSVWSIAVQADMGGRLGVPRRTLGVAGLLNIALAALTGTLVGLPAVPLLLRRAPEDAVSPWWVVLAILLAVVVLWPRLLNALLDRGLRLLGRQPLPQPLSARALATTVVFFVGAWVAMGAAAWVLAAGLAPDVEGRTLFLAAVCGFCLAAAIGMFSVLVPAGFGVRDGLLVLMLAPFTSTAAATAVVVVHRFLSVVIDLLVAGGAYLWARRHHLIGSGEQ